MNPVPLMKTLVADSLTNRNSRDASASKKELKHRIHQEMWKIYVYLFTFIDKDPNREGCGLQKYSPPNPVLFSKKSKCMDLEF